LNSKRTKNLKPLFPWLIVLRPFFHILTLFRLLLVYLGSISPTFFMLSFYARRSQKRKKTDNLTVILHFWAPRAWKLYVECWWNSALMFHPILLIIKYFKRKIVKILPWMKRMLKNIWANESRECLFNRLILANILWTKKWQFFSDFKTILIRCH